jgi:hypothetical protein
VTVSIYNVDLIQRLYQLTHKIYRDILCIKMNQSTMIVALVGLASGFNRDYMGEILPHWPVIQLSWELLRFVSVEGGILSSFTC